jgi:hypothetical protein
VTFVADSQNFAFLIKEKPEIHLISQSLTQSRQVTCPRHHMFAASEVLSIALANAVRSSIALTQRICHLALFDLRTHRGQRLPHCRTARESEAQTNRRRRFDLQTPAAASTEHWPIVCWELVRCVCDGREKETRAALDVKAAIQSAIGVKLSPVLCQRAQVVNDATLHYGFQQFRPRDERLRWLDRNQARACF